MEKSLEYDLTVLTGDLDIKIGRDNSEYEDIMGRHELEEINEIVRDLQLCTSNKIIINGTIFPHRRIY